MVQSRLVQRIFWGIAVLLSVFFVMLHTPKTANATNPTTINFQGKVVNADGTNVTNGTYTFVFSLYSASGGGSALWTETDSLTVTNGVFQVNLGAGCSFFVSNACNNSTPIDFGTASSLYMGMTFNSDPNGEMSPRMQFQSVPYAYNSDKVGGLAVSQLVQLSPGSTQTGFIDISGTINGATLSGGSLSGTAVNSLLVSGTAITGTGALAVTAGGAGQNLTLNGTTTGKVVIANTSTGDVEIGGGYGSTGCSVSTAGALSCDGAVLAGTYNGATIASTTFNSLTLSGTAVTGSGALAVAAGSTAQNLTLNASTSGLVQIGGTSTGNIELGGGSGSTGCTLTNTTGAYACTGAITATGGLSAGSNATAGSLVLNDGTGTGDTVTVNMPNLTAAYSLTLPATGPAVSQCLKTDAATASQLLFGDCAANAQKVMQSFNTYGLNQLANVTTAQNFLIPTTSATTHSIAVAGTTEVRAASAGSFRSCTLMSSAAVTAGTVSVVFRKNGANVTGTSRCTLNSTTLTRTNAEEVASGVETFAAGDTIGIALVSSVGFTPTTLEHWASFSIEYGSGGSGPTTLQDSYSNGNTITSTDARDLQFTLANTTTDSNFLVNVATGSASKFAVQNNGTDVLSIGSAGNLVVTGTINTATISGGTLSGTAVNSLLVSGTAITGTGALAVTSGGTAQNLTLNGTTTGEVQIGGASTGDILFGGGVLSTGCTVTNASGNLACTGTINGASISGGTVSSGTLTSTAVNSLGVTSSAITATGALAVSTGAGTDLTLNAGTTGQMLLGGTSTGDILFGGGSGSTGCTLTNASGNLACAGSFTATGGSLTLGSTTSAGTILLQDGTVNNRTISLITPALTTSYTLTYADSGATGNQCLQSSVGSTSSVTVLEWGSCAGLGGGSTLQDAYDATSGNTITTSSARDITFTLSDDATDSNLIVNTVTGSTSKFATQYNGSDTFSISNSAGSQGAAFFKSATDSSNAFQVQNSAGDKLINLNSSAVAQLVGNNSMESGISGWGSEGTVTLESSDIVATQTGYGSRFLNVTTNAASEGANYRVPLKNGTQYSLSVWVRQVSGSAAVLDIGYEDNADTNCLTGQTLNATWTQFTCTFTPNAVGATSNIYIRQTDATARNIYIDGLSLVESASALVFDAGGENFNIQSLSSNTTINANNTGELQPMQLNANPVTTALRHSSSATANGYMYVIGGCTGACGAATDVATVYVSKIGADGSLGTWTTLTAIPDARYGHTTFVQNGYIYVVGGDNGAGAFGATPQTTVYYAKLNNDGTVGTWRTSASVLPAARSFQSSSTINGFAYVIGGDDAGAQSTVYYAKLYADGSTGTWTTTTALTTGAAARRYHTSVFANGYMYVMGGDTGGTDQSTVYYNSVNADGTLGASWASTTALPNARSWHTSVVANGYIYAIGGESGGTAQTSIYYAKANANGTVGSWQSSATVNALPDARYGHVSAIQNGYVYSLGGTSDGTTAQATAYYGSTARVLVGGSLDLVGLSTHGLSDSGGGGSIVAGNIRAIGRLQVEGYADINGGLSVDSSLNVNAVSGSVGQTVFNINNSASNSIFSVRHMSTNFGSLASAGAFMGTNSYFGEEYNTGHVTNCNTTAALSAGTTNGYARGDKGGSSATATACASGAVANVNGGHLNVADVIGTATIANNQCLISSQNAVNGIERISATIVTPVAGSKAACAETLAGNATTSNKIYSTTNLPVITAKVKMQAFSANATGSVFVVGANIRNHPGTDGAGVNLPNTGVFFTNCSTYTAGVPSGCSNTNWYGMVTNANALVGTVQTCTGPGSLAGNFAYLRVEVRAVDDIHFYSDFNTSDGISEIECGSGVTSASNTAAMAPWIEVKAIANAALTNTLDVDYYRSWQDDNLATSDAGEQGPPLDEVALGALTESPVSIDPGSSYADQSGFFSFNAATSEDMVYEKDVYVKGTLFADKIKANQIEGLEIFTDKINSLQAKLAQEQNTEATPPADGQSTPESSRSDNNIISTGGSLQILDSAGTSMAKIDNLGNATFVGSLQVANAIVDGSLSVGSDLNVGGLSTFQKLATFIGKVVFRQDVQFDGHLAVGNDSAGYALIRKDESNVHVEFTRPYDVVPVVNANTSDGQFVSAAVKNVTVQGFDITTKDPLTQDTTFSWTAVGANNPLTANNPVAAPAP